MWSSVANLKESLHKIALDVHDDDDEEDLSIYTTPQRDQFDNSNSLSERRVSRNFNGSLTPTRSPIANGLGSPSNPQIEQYVAEIKRLKDSEAEIKALSVNYAALLKEKENQISRLMEENDTMKQNLVYTNAAHNSSRTVPRVGGDVSPSRHNKAQTKLRTSGSPLSNGNVPKHDAVSNGTTSAHSKELLDTIEEKNKAHALIQASHEAQLKKIVADLDNERDKLASMQKKLQEEQKLNGSFQQELSSLKDENSKMLIEIHKTRDELNKKMSEVGRLQEELQRLERNERNGSIENLRSVIATLEDENRSIKKEKGEIEASLRASHSSRKDVPDQDNLSNGLNKVSPGMEEMQQSLSNLEKDLKETCRERDKALQELNRLKQHLLEKESEESEKMDEDSKIIEELRETNEHQRYQISRLENALKKAIGAHDEIKMSNSSELKAAKETIDMLNRKLAGSMSTLDAKNMEVLNLQTALGQYYAEIEAKEHFAEELSVAKEELTRLSKQLKEADQQAEASKREKEELLGKLSQAERMLADSKSRVKKVEEDNEKLRRALEQSMTRLNRMSMDSDYLVDRRIVIKLLVTYFQRNHSKEVLDLMVRVLGFSDEDKQRIGLAQQGSGRGVVRGVLGLPGRLVGGILGGSSAEASAAVASENQSFADLWVDFLVNEAEREKRESESAGAGAGAGSGSTPAAHFKHAGNNTTPPAAAASNHRGGGGFGTVSTTSIPLSHHHNQNQSHNFMHREHSDSEFSTVPLTSESNSRSSILID
ncbi:golgin candidate 3-like [Andrographis paniculata]|uniref:golgin candidate 3-like n=1 Tax=Andrographis paniculata TaxID=175694 RepID=UPI0021E786AD|nr:golgin candidate 3-like [Andrographis paniculata]